ncbi:VanW family protein [Pendulispora rubella]|uniref:VanW family protein n=1 Tax=Pendulispora rubella TaxID=2741070 RepID=A0ABZ2L1M2_9BACT
MIRPHGDCPRWLQENKVTNLATALPFLDGLIVRPGEYFSFCHVVGRPTRARGFVDGMELAQGRARPGVGGGICQLANMIHWLALHSPLVVVERSTHSMDPFPDRERSIPFGTGASIFYNYIDLVIHNPTRSTFQFRFQLSTRDLIGELRSSKRLKYSYSVFEREHRFVRQGGDVFRENSLWRRIRLRQGGALIGEEFIKRNRARVLYEVEPQIVEAA